MVFDWVCEDAQTRPTRTQRLKNSSSNDFHLFSLWCNPVIDVLFRHFPTSWLLNRRVIQRSDASCMNYTDHTQFLTILNYLIINATSSTSSFWWFFSGTSLVSLRASCRPSCKAPAFSTTAAFPRRCSRRKAINFLIYIYMILPEFPKFWSFVGHRQLAPLPRPPTGAGRGHNASGRAAAPLWAAATNGDQRGGDETGGNCWASVGDVGFIVDGFRRHRFEIIWICTWCTYVSISAYIYIYKGIVLIGYCYCYILSIKYVIVLRQDHTVLLSLCEEDLLTIGGCW